MLRDFLDDFGRSFRPPRTRALSTARLEQQPEWALGLERRLVAV